MQADDSCQRDLKEFIWSLHPKAYPSQILNEKVGYEQIREEIYLITRECQRQTRALLTNQLDKFKNPLTDKLKAMLSGEIPSWKGNLWRLTRRYEAWVRENMEEEIRHISKTENRHFYSTLNNNFNVDVLSQIIVEYMLFKDNP